MDNACISSTVNTCRVRCISGVILNSYCDILKCTKYDILHYQYFQQGFQ